TGQGPARGFGVAVELPEQGWFAVGAVIRSKTVHVAVAASEDRLRHTAENRSGGAGPLAVQDVLTRRIVSPDQLTGLFVEAEEARGLGGGQLRRRFPGAVAGIDQQQIAPGGHAAGSHISLTNP